MRLLAVLTLVLIPICVSAQENYGVMLNDVTDAKGNRIQFHTDTDRLARTPDWSPGTQDPPLTITAVTRIAIEAGKRRLPKADDIAVQFITLRKADAYGGSPPNKFTRWYYQVSVSPIVAGETFFKGSSIIDIVILLDGTVVEPTPAK
jgi:hypothetical protein